MLTQSPVHNKGPARDGILASFAVGLIGTLVIGVIVLLPADALLAGSRIAKQDEQSDASLAAAIERAGDNAEEIKKAFAEVPSEQKEGMEFLVKYMPQHDLQSLKADFLLNNVRLAYEALENSPWAKQVPQDVFFNDVLPYASINERRDDWRQDFYKRFQPLIKDAKTPGEAAAMLNQKIFPLLEVRYSTKRRRADQSPLESIDSGLASCTGLSVLLIDACRAVGVPARFVGTPLWSDNSGNHSWVEVWDDGWHFTGAAEPSGDRLDEAWFTGRASAAKRDDQRHAIYAVSYKTTPLFFPMVWARETRWVHAVNVTDRYARKTEPLAEGMARVYVRVADKDNERVAAAVKFIDSEGEVVFSGESNDERFDANNHVTATLKLGETYQLKTTWESKELSKEVTGFADETLVTVRLNEEGWQEEAQAEKDENDSASEQLAETETGQKLVEALQAYFATPADQRSEIKFDEAFDKLLVEQPTAVRQLAWEAWTKGDEAKKRIADYEEDQVTWEDYTSPYVVKDVGQRPGNGWPLFIAMHGGGGVPKRFNDSQWEHMQIYYRDQKDVEGYRYLALRAPTDEWNGFYTNYNLPMTNHLIEQFLIAGDVDPNRIYIMGYSHGGYGTWYIARQMADRFAAAHASASAPSIGNDVGRNMRNTRFSFMFGEKDTSYERLKRCRSFEEFMKEVMSEPGNEDYPVVAEFQAGYGHGGLPDRDKIKEMYSFERTPRPSHVTWLPTNPKVTQFNWLEVEEVSGGQVIDAKLDGQDLKVEAKKTPKLIVYVDERMVDVKEKLAVNINGEESEVSLQPSLKTLVETLATRGDDELAFTVRLEFTTQIEDTEE